MFHNNVIAKVLRLLNCREKHVKLTAIRFVRTCIALKDEFYNKNWAKTQMAATLFCAKEWFKDSELLISYSDIFYEFMPCCIWAAKPKFFKPGRTIINSCLIFCSSLCSQRTIKCKVNLKVK